MAMTISGSNGVTYPDGTSQASGSQACKAWVNFNGTGTVAIRAAYNVSSITDNGTGNYTVNFTNALTDGNYATNITSRSAGSNVVDTSVITDQNSGTYTTNAVSVWTGVGQTGTPRDVFACCVSVFR